MNARVTCRGFALVSTLFALVLVGALVGGAFFAALQELRVARNAGDAQRALAAAESAADLAIAGWDGSSLNAMPVGDSQPVSVALPSSAGPAFVTVLRLNPQIFLVRATGGEPAAGTSRSVGRVVRLDMPRLAMRAAISVLTPADPAAAVIADGADRDPPGWTCDAGPRDTVPGIQVGPWPLDWDSLAALARTAVDPAAAQAELGAGRPFVLVRGDLTLTGGRGGGILLVEGDLTLQSGFEFDGVVIVRGALSILDSGVTLRGAVAAGSLRAGSASATIGYSSCAVARALGAGTHVRPLTSRAWAMLY